MGILQARILEWVVTPPGDLPDPAIEPVFLTVSWAGSLPLAPPGKPHWALKNSDINQIVPDLCEIRTESGS